MTAFLPAALTAPGPGVVAGPYSSANGVVIGGTAVSSASGVTNWAARNLAGVNNDALQSLAPSGADPTLWTNLVGFFSQQGQRSIDVNQGIATANLALLSGVAGVPGGSYAPASSPMASAPGFVSGGPVAGGGGVTQPGGSVSGGLSGALSSLSHTTAGINWSHILLWLAIVGGAYLVITHRKGLGKQVRHVTKGR